MDNVIEFEQYRNSTERKTVRLDGDDATKSAIIILFTGVRIEYENKDVVPDSPSKPKRRTSGDG